MHTSVLPRQRRRFATLRAVYALVLREMATTYGKAFGGYLWTIAEPVFGIALLSVVFSLAFRSPSLGTNFAIFFAAGYLPFTAYNDIARKAAHAITFNRSLLVYPSVTFADALLARVALALITQVVVYYLIITAIETLYDTGTTHSYAHMVSAISAAAALGFGVGCLNCFLFGMFPVWQRLWNIVTRPLFLVSGVLFIYEDVPRSFQAIVWWNPLMHITGQGRRGFYPTYEAGFVNLAFVYGVALTCAAIGIFLLFFFHRKILNVR